MVNTSDDIRLIGGLSRRNPSDILALADLRARLGVRGRVLAIGTACLGAVLAAPEARAANECGAGPTVTCTSAGNPYAGGISYSNFNAPETVTLQTGVVITPASGIAGVVLSGVLAGIQTVNSNVGVTIETTGDNAGGIRVNSTSDAISVTSASVVTHGNTTLLAGAAAIQTTTSGSGVAGNITIDASKGVGLLETFGTTSQAVQAQSSGGTIDITVGTVKTHGAGSTAINATILGGTGNLAVHVLGDITVTGTGADAFGGFAGGIHANNSGSGTISITTKSVSTTSDNGGAVGAQANGGAIIIDTTGGTISTTGAAANGVGTSLGSTSGPVTITTGTISTLGNLSIGVVGLTKGPNAALTIDTTAGPITTHGTNATGINAVTGSFPTSAQNAGKLTIHAGDVTTLGTATGIIAAARGGDVDITAGGTIATTNGDGIATQLANTAGTSTTTINVTGAITTGGASAHGINAQVITGGTNTITVSGSVTASAGMGILSSGTGDHTTIDPGASVSGVTGIQFTSTGTGATLINSGTVTGTGANAISFSGTADTFTNNGTVNGSVSLGSGNDTATLNTGSTITGTLNAGNNTDTLKLGGAGASTLDISRATNFEIGQKIDSGTWTLTGTGTISTSTTISAGVLKVDGQLTSTAVATDSGGTLGGSGTLVGAVTVANGGTLAGLAGQTLTMNSLVLNSGSIVTAALGSPSTTRLFNVTGGLTLAGTLNVTDIGGFGAGVYRLFDYGGALTDNGLAVGSLPGISTGAVQTAIANQVNLVVSPPAIQFWNGTTTTPTGTIVGGPGTWTAGPLTNWTNANGSVSAAWGGQFAVFQGPRGGTNGPVQVDGSAGTVSATGMQFIGTGWQVAGDPITLTPVSGATVIRVGDGSLAGATDAATIGSILTGNSRLVKEDLGSLILTAANTYTGNTTINAGTLQLGNGGASGSIVGDVTNSATLAFNRSDNFVFGGQISGAGSVNQLGPGTLTLTNANTYTGGTTVSAGTLAMGADNNIGTGPLALLGGTTLRLLNGFTFTHAVTVAGSSTIDVAASTNTMGDVIADGAQPGGIFKTGSGTLVLAANNTYSGGTTISGGTLQLGVGGSAGSIAGAVSNNGALAVNRSDTYNFNGLISGAGSLNQIGTGTTVLIADNTYTGGTIISAGTLQLGNGATSGSILGDVLDNGVLAVNHTNAVTLGGVISGTGAFQQNSTGTTTLTAANTYTGATTVNAGTLSVNGSIASAVTVNNGGTLGGNGTVGPITVNAGGTLSPGNSIGLITINGNLVLGPGSVYTVEVSPSAADRTNVIGSAILNGTVNAIFGPGNYSSNSYTILSALGGSSGKFANLTTTGLPATLSASLSYTASDVMLVTLTSQMAPVVATLTGNTLNQRAVAGAQDTAFNAGKSSIGALYNLTLAQLPGALDQLSGEVHPSTAGVLVDESLYARSAILGRLRQVSYGGNTQMASLATGGPRAFAGGEEMNTALAYAKSLPTKAPPTAASSYDVVYWAQGFGAWGRFNGDGNAANVNRDLAGFFSGVDTRVGTDGRAGIAAGYTGSRNALDGRGSSTVETGHIAGYGGWGFGAVNLRAGGDYAFHTIDTSRTAFFPGFADTDTARYDGGTAQIFGEAGYGLAFGNVAVEPFAGGAWVHLHTDAFNERGGAAALSVAANEFEVGYSTLGIRAATMIPIAADMVLVPRASASWQHAFDSVTPTGTMAFQNAGVPFVIAGVPIARDAALAEAGLDLAIGRNATVGISYTGQIANNVQDHAAKGKFSWKF